ncbi:MAG: SHOCT domain-containing protein [Kosmotoga sp.]|nr:MAG: SHOCT domain-containing protein [Kosmotoga sp.]
MTNKSNNDKIEKLEKLSKLKEKGIIDEEEFKELKKDIMNIEEEDKEEKIRELLRKRKNNEITAEEYRKRKSEIKGEKNSDNIKTSKIIENKKKTDKQKLIVYFIVPVILIFSVVAIFYIKYQSERKKLQGEMNKPIYQSKIRNNYMIKKKVKNRYEIVITEESVKNTMEKKDVLNFVRWFRDFKSKKPDSVFIMLFKSKKAQHEKAPQIYPEIYNRGHICNYYGWKKELVWAQKKGKFSDLFGEKITLE